MAGGFLRIFQALIGVATTVGCGGEHEILFSNDAKNGATGGERGGMRAVGESVDERAGAVSDRVYHFGIGDDGAERGVSAGDALGRADIRWAERRRRESRR